jgi:lambda family phage portal protein
LRPGQRRGIPLIAPIIELCLTLDRYLKAETIAAQIQALFTLVITSENPDSMAGELGSLEGDEMTGGDDSLVALGNGIVQYARPGEKVEPVNPSRPTTSFEPFVNSAIQLMGPTSGMPYEMLVQKFQSSYSASRAAINMASTQFKILRSGLINDFCQPIYEAFMDEAVARGWVYAPGYFENPIMRRAYTRAKWNGPGLPQVDMLKEVQAWEKQVSLGFATAGQATSELNGGDFMENLSIRAREIEAATAAGLSQAAATGMTASVSTMPMVESEKANEEGGSQNG